MNVIEVNNISKIYDLGLVGTGTLSKDLNRTWARLRGKPDPYATLAELNDRTQKTSSGTVFALKDIDFKVAQGEVLGIIGKNGAGKSTLLKILSQITSPTSGDIRIKGRVAALLEVGTGMHPEMTARQNIYLNGSIMGMRRFEITSKLDEIIDFAGIEKYIDTPIKRFSSGMKVRLGFAVAAFLEPEILIVDEVLAVGDAEFQQKAIGKMQDVSKGQGRTVLFVSHNMAAVESLTNRAILLSNGQISFEGGVKETIKQYIQSNTTPSAIVKSDNTDIELSDFYITNKDGEILNVVLTGEDLIFNFEVHNKTNQELKNSVIGVGLINMENVYVTSLKSEYQNVYFDIKPGLNHFKCHVNKLPILSGSLSINVMINAGGKYRIHHQDLYRLSIENGVFYESGKLPIMNNQIFLINQTWE